MGVWEYGSMEEWKNGRMEEFVGANLVFARYHQFDGNGQ
jgi:hypothetical protein